MMMMEGVLCGGVLVGWGAVGTLIVRVGWYEMWLLIGRCEGALPGQTKPR